MSETNNPSAQVASAIEKLKIEAQDIKNLQIHQTPVFKLSNFIKHGTGLLKSNSSPSGETSTSQTAEAHEDEAYEPDDAEDVVMGDYHNNEPEEVFETSDTEDIIEEDGDDFNVELNGKSMKALSWLNSLRSQVQTLNDIKPVTTCPRLTQTPKEYQYKALACAEHNAESPLKGILIADPPGFGKTLVAMMGVVRLLEKAKRPIFIALPMSLVKQWISEFDKFFEAGTVNVFFLNEPHVECTELLKYDVILLTYGFIRSQHNKLVKYKAAIEDYENGKSNKAPSRPNLSIFSEELWHDNIRSPALICDEGHVLKNPKSMTHQAVHLLRQQAESCILLTGSPADNNWVDLYGLSRFIGGHPIQTKAIYLALFSEKDPQREGRRKPPKGKYLARLLTFLRTWILLRPGTLLQLQPLEQRVVEFSLTKAELDASNDEFAKYERSIGQDEGGYTLTTIRTTGSRRQLRRSTEHKNTAAFGPLMKAQQHAYHPGLVQIMEHVRNERKKNSRDADDDVDAFSSAAEITLWTTWQEELRVDNKWESSRVRRIIFEFNKVRDLDEDCKILVFDEMVFFLDVLEIAFQEMAEPVKVYRYDGRSDATARTVQLERFKAAPAPAVMLISKSAGGLGLNITEANVVFICGPWWKESDESQAVGRAWRFGQKKPVLTVRFEARAKSDRNKISKRDKKKFHNRVVMKNLERPVIVFDNLK